MFRKVGLSLQLVVCICLLLSVSVKGIRDVLDNSAFSSETNKIDVGSVVNADINAKDPNNGDALISETEGREGELFSGVDGDAVITATPDNDTDDVTATQRTSLNKTDDDDEEGLDYEYDYIDALNSYNWAELLPTLFVYSLTMVLGITGNSLIIFTICRYRRMKSTTNVFLASLASADLLLITICIPVKAPALSGSAFFNYKNQHSIVLMASCDANYCFTFVDIGGAGRQSDGGVFGQAKFGQAILDETLPLPPPMSIFGYTLPCVFVADAAFPLRNNLMRPYPSSSAEPDNFVFNYRLSRVRRMIENCFGILASRWRIYRKPIIATVPTIEAIVKATVCLHNWLQKFSNMKRTRYCPAGLIDEEDEDGVVTQGTWRNTQMAGLVPLPRAGANRCAQSAKAVRDELPSYFVNEGAVPWQWTRLHR